jgi:ATP-binding cassette subfamily B protein
MDCGPTCIRMISKYYGGNSDIALIREQSYITKQGVNMLGLIEAAEKIGFRSLPVKIPIYKLRKEQPLPCILHWDQNHFVVLYKIDRDNCYIADPENGKMKLSHNEFAAHWLGANDEGIALLLEPTQTFYKVEKGNEKIRGYRFLLDYAKPYRKYFIQVLISMLVASMLMLIAPFLTQLLVDKGISRRDFSLVKLILVFQIMIFLASSAVELLRGWLLLHINTRINISIISDFLIKLMKLPISFFDTKQVGDIRQRVSDHHRIQGFLTNTALVTIFSMVNMVVYSGVLLYYSVPIFICFLTLSLLSVGWIVLFLKQRKKLDYLRFKQQSANENQMFELITGMQDIKLNNCERNKRWKWEKLQAKMFKVNIKTLYVGQKQDFGAQSLNQLKNILVSFFAASEVINGSMTLGMMLSVSFIIGQLQNPIQTIITFIQAAQDAQISLERLNEIHIKKDERSEHNTKVVENINEHDIIVKNLSYQYTGSNSPFVLKNVNFTIFNGKTTAIVGMSGSGKTTLMKLLLQYYEPTQGAVYVGDTNLQAICPLSWRAQCGVVQQEGYIFDDTIKGNIAASDEIVDEVRLNHAIDIANLRDFIDELPLGINTKIGISGNGISSGQRQRVLIARAVYKKPSFLLLDEATSSLDANNESKIYENFSTLFKGKTVLVIAHRLSTIKNADQIVVLDKGEVYEVGNHDTLLLKNGKYAELVENQMSYKYA